MHLANQLLNQLVNPTLNRQEKAQLRCRLAKEFEEAGEYEEAREAMGELWQCVGEHPVLDGLDRIAMAEVLLRAGALTGWIGSTKQIDGAQETAKNLISESLSIFEALKKSEKVAEARNALAICYWREGAFDEARIILREVLCQISESSSEQKAWAWLNSAIVERKSNRNIDALRILTEAAPLIETSSNHALKGKFHNQLALVLRNIGTTEYGKGFTNRALVEYTAASYHFEQAEYIRYHGCVENNLGFLYFTLYKFPEAHEHLDRARRLLVSLRDDVHTAQVDETRARVMLAEGHVKEAEAVARAAVRTLEQGDKKSLLAEAMTTHGTALARMGRHKQAQFTLHSAAEIAEVAGDVDGAGQSVLTSIEELGERFIPAELAELYERAAELLVNSQHPGVLARLSACARRVLYIINAQRTQNSPPEFNASFSWEGFSFWDAVQRYERYLIEGALKETHGVVSRAAQLLGFNHHQSLVAILNGRHKELLHARTPVVARKRSAIRRANFNARPAATQQTHPVTILHVEDNTMVSATVKDTLKLEGWRVEVCADAATAMKRIMSAEHYDLLLLDYDLPDSNGVVLIKEARQLSHRRRTPIVMLSASDCERQAWHAGADAFLRKPEDILTVSETIARLLNRTLSQSN